MEVFLEHGEDNAPELSPLQICMKGPGWPLEPQGSEASTATEVSIFISRPFSLTFLLSNATSTEPHGDTCPGGPDLFRGLVINQRDAELILIPSGVGRGRRGGTLDSRKHQLGKSRTVLPRLALPAC